MKTKKYFQILPLLLLGILSFGSCDTPSDGLEKIHTNTDTKEVNVNECDTPLRWSAWAVYDGATIEPTLQYRFYDGSRDIASINKIDSGTYRATFPGFGFFEDGGSAVHVAAFGGGHKAQVARWDTIGNDLNIYVKCFDSSGNLINDVGFTVFVYSRNENITTNSAYLWNNSSCFSYNSKDGRNTINKVSTGRYEVKFPGIEVPNGIQGNVQVTPYGDVGGYCQIESVVTDPSGVTVTVNTYDNNGDLADTIFTISYFGDKILSYFNPAAYLRYDGTIARGNFQVNFPSDQEMNVIKIAPGHYCVEIPNKFRQGWHTRPLPLVTSYGTDGSYAYISKIRLGSTGTIIHVKIKMPNGDPIPANPKFYMFFHTGANL